MKKRMMFVLFVLVLMLASVYPQNFTWQTTAVCESMYLGQSQMNWVVLGVVGVFISFGVMVAIYLFGKAVNLSGISAWGQNELWQVIATVFLLIFLFALIPVLDQIGKTANPSCPPGACSEFELPDGTTTSEYTLIQSAYFYCEGMASELGFLTFVISTIHSIMKMFFSFELTLTPINLIGVTIKLGSMFGTVSQIIGWSMTILGPAMLSWIGKMIILCFAADKMFVVFLPLGFILRSFPTTRSVGGGLIALALGLYFVYPFMLNINNIIVSSFLGIKPSEMINFASKSFFGLSTDPAVFANRPARLVHQAVLQKLDVFAVQTMNTFDIFSPAGFNVDAIFLRFLFFVNPGYIAGIVSSMYITLLNMFLQDFVYLVIIGSAILPVLNIFITFTFVQEVGKFLGSDMNLAELVKII